MMRLGITGFPLSHTRSPGLHRGFLRKAGLQGSYEVLPFDPGLGKAAFFEFLEARRREGYRGLNVTIPHKEWAFEYAIRLGGATPGPEGRCAKLVRAANTLVFDRSGKVRAANTDAVGLWDDLGSWLGRIFPGNGTLDLVIIGTGGAARGALAGLLAGHPVAKRVRHVRIWGRHAGKKRALLKLVPEKFTRADDSPERRTLLVLWCLAPVSRAQAKAVFREIAPAGHGHRSPEIILYDLNYGKRAQATEGLVSSRRRRSGMGMLRGQAAAAFRLWSGRHAKV